MKIFLIALSVIFGILLLLLLLLLIKVRLNVVYDGEPTVRLKYLFLTFTLYPKKEKVKKAKKTKKQKTVKKSSEPKKKKDIRRMFSFYKEIVTEVILPASSRLLEKLTVRVNSLKVTVASDNAAETAILYGVASGGCAMLFELLSQISNFSSASRDDVYIGCRYDTDETTCKADIELRLRALFAITSLLPPLMRYLEIKEEFGKNAGQTE